MKGLGALSVEGARELRRDLKSALTGFANGKGTIEGLLHEIERIAKSVSGRHDASLRQAGKAMKRLVRCYAPARLEDTGLPGVKWDELYSRVVTGRNDIMHTGTEAALAGTRVATVGTVILSALAGAAKADGMGTVKDVMVSNPICAHDWQTLADLRRTMLVNDYSALPLSEGENEGTWSCVRAEELAGFLARQDRCGRGCDLAGARCGKLGTRMPLFPARVVEECTPLEKLLGEAAPDLPVVVARLVGERREIVGIVTAFDLL